MALSSEAEKGQLYATIVASGDLGRVLHSAVAIDPTRARTAVGVAVDTACRYAPEAPTWALQEAGTRYAGWLLGCARYTFRAGVPVCVVEDQFQFILHHKILWEDCVDPSGGSIELEYLNTTGNGFRRSGARSLELSPYRRRRMSA